MSTNRHLVFSTAWAERWRQEIAASPEYGEAGRDWQGDLVLAFSDRDGAVWVDLARGRCLGCRPAQASDRERAAYVLVAPETVWRRVLAGELAPVWALVSRKVKLERGRLAELTPHARAAQELVRAASRVPTTFSSESEGPGETGAPAEARGPTASTPAPQEAARFQSTSSRGLDWENPALRLFQKAKRMGIWNPMDLDFGPDREDWTALEPLEREVILHLVSLFQGGEEAVTLDLLPLIRVIAKEGRLEEEMYLTSFLWEEAKHVEFFRRFLDEVAEDRSDLARFHGPAYGKLFHQELPEALHALDRDPSPSAQARASVTYNMIVEGVLAETGYHAFFQMLKRRGILPGTVTGIENLKADESRHLAYGVFLLSRLVAEHGEAVWAEVERRMEGLFPVALGLIEEIFEAYDNMPFGLTIEEFTDYAIRQFRSRFERIERARRQSLAEVLGG